MGRSNCSRVLVYSAVIFSACSHTPVAIEHVAAVARSTIHSTIAAPVSRSSSTSLPATRTPSSSSRASGIPDVVSWRSRVTPLELGSTISTTMAPSSPADAGTSTRSATSPAGTHVLTPSTRQPSPSARAVVVGWSASLPVSTSAAVSTVSPSTTPGRYCCFCASVPNCASGSAPSTTVGSTGTGATVRPISSSSRHKATNPRPLPPASSGKAIPSSPAFASSDQVSRSKPSPPASSSLSRSCVMRSDRIWRARSRVASCSSLNEKSICPSLALRHRHAEAEHRDQIALHLVHAAAEGQDDQAAVVPLEARLQHRVGRSLLEVSRLADHLEHEAERLEIELGAEHLDRRRVGDVEALLGRVPRHLPVGEAQELEPGVDASEVDLHPLLVDDAPAVGELRLLRPPASVGERALDDPRRAQRDPLAGQLIRDQAPAVVLATDERRRRDAHVVVEDLVDVVIAHQIHRHELDAGRVHRDDEHRDSLVLLRLRVGADGEPAVVGAAGEAREHLLAVDDVLVAVAYGLRRQRGEVGAGAGLRVADAEVDLALEDAGQEVGLLIVGPEVHDRRPDGIDREHRDGGAGAHRLVEEDELLDGRAALAAVLLGPADPEPAFLAHLPDDLPVHGADAVPACEAFLDLGCQQFVVVGAELTPQVLLLLAVPV